MMTLARVALTIYTHRQLQAIDTSRHAPVMFSRGYEMPILCHTQKMDDLAEFPLKSIVHNEKDRKKNKQINKNINQK